MKTVEELIQELQKYPPKACVAAYTRECAGIVVYPAHNKKIKRFSKQWLKATESTGFIDLPFRDPADET